MSVTRQDVVELLRLLDAVPADELELATERFTLSLRRTGDGEWVQEHRVHTRPNLIELDEAGAEEAHGRPAAGAAPAEGGDAPAATGAGPVDAQGGGSPAAREGLVDVVAPLLGTFYRAPKPGADPFVEVGSPVDADTVVGLVETMKLFTSVPAGAAGTVAEICVADAEFVQQGTVVLRLEPPG